MTIAKVCPDCKREKPLSMFGENRARPDGRQVYCRPCWNARSKRYAKPGLKKRLDAAERELGLHRLNDRGNCPICYDTGYNQAVRDVKKAMSGFLVLDQTHAVTEPVTPAPDRYVMPR